MKTELLQKLEDIRKEIEAMPDDEKSVDTSDFLRFVDKRTGVCLIENRNHGLYSNQSFFLNDDFCWELKNDGACLVLIPTRK